MVTARFGLWSHGRCRNGGLPGWPAGTGGFPGPDNPAYLAPVRPYLARMVHELRGLRHRGGGPVIAVQVENELDDRSGRRIGLRALGAPRGARHG
ncbi:Glycosyl hydrolases family 35 [Streptomyces sp. MP131-18]|nr:Glycosyl hydrolases family 35 [Streptomyces sp. MP131-18]